MTAALHKNSCSSKQNKVWRNNCGFKGRCVWQLLLLPPTLIVATASLLRGLFFFFHFPLWFTFPPTLHKYSISATWEGYTELRNTSARGTHWPECFRDFFSPKRTIITSLFLFGGVLCAISGRQWLPSQRDSSMAPWNASCFSVASL